ncbi:hypothetical protein JT328_gp56 [Aeromonas phage BUCT551]|uniref:Neck protein n=2 Tax=Sharonstreetvirus TaxID=2943019 RepID=A0AAE9YK36_9CAUD|nr:hypothetical protein JT328_gp56 [Aeromonas phage BUCT551]QOI69672.1 hypothetical protein [Aeromonas phage BUCT551]UIS24828.1 hypothetical protein pAEv1812_19 [Aeromonas phage pAEv1812]WCZ66090.1 hypothetical protein phiA034_gene0007 [Aeromonas phage phiA034]
MITVASDDLEGLAQYFRTAADAAVPAMRMAINDVATRGGMALIREEMTDQIAFPSGYLTGDRIGVTKRATNASLEAVITGRKRATSLARFTSARSVNQKGGVSVRVTKGRTTYLKQAWLVRLKKGASLDEDNYNIGLAIRLRPGEKLNKKTVHQSWLVAGQVALLYGPSVDQVFQEVAGDVVDPISEMVEDEFFRQFARLTRG